MNKKIADASKDLASADVSVLVYGCTSGSILEGIEHDNKLIQTIENITNTRIITITTAVIEAINCLKIHKISVITPYVDELNRYEKKFLEKNVDGLKVLSIKGLQIIGNLPKGKLDPFSSYHIIKKWDTEESEGIFISCTNWRTFEIIDFLEKDLNKPIITSNQVALWKALRLIDVRDRLPGLARARIYWLSHIT
jgi:maleate isomerase